MGKICGEPFKGEVTSTDASPGVAATLYKSGSLSSFTLASDEYLEITHVEVVADAGGDVQVFSGADQTIGNGETIVRGTVAANGGIVQDLSDNPHVCQPGHDVYIDAPAGQVDLLIRGGVRKVDNTGNRPSWKE